MAVQPTVEDSDLTALAFDMHNLSRDESDPEATHVKADALLCKVLEVLASEGSAHTQEMIRWVLQDYHRINKWCA